MDFGTTTFSSKKPCLNLVGNSEEFGQKCPQEPRVSPDGRAAGGQRQGNEAAAEGLLVHRPGIDVQLLIMESAVIHASTNNDYGTPHNSNYAHTLTALSIIQFPRLLLLL